MRRNQSPCTRPSHHRPRRGPAPRAELLHVLMLPDFDRADRIGEFWSYPESRTFAELLIERGGPDAPGVLLGRLREAERND